MKKLLKKGTASLLLLALLLCLFCGGALADGVIANSGESYIRDQPNKGGSILGALKKGEQAEYLGETSTDYRGIDWYYIYYRGLVGWVSSRYTDLFPDHSYQPSYQPSYAWGLDQTDSFDTAGGEHYIIASEGRTYIRSAPSVNADDLGMLPKDGYALYLDEYSIAPNGRYWYKVKYSGITGWVSGKYTILQ